MPKSWDRAVEHLGKALGHLEVAKALCNAPVTESDGSGQTAYYASLGDIDDVVISTRTAISTMVILINDFERREAAAKNARRVEKAPSVV